ncbi:MAG: creatininase family protein [Myxococcota bacterium]
MKHEVIPGVGPNDPRAERAEFLRRVRAEAAAAGVDVEPIIAVSVGPGPRAEFRESVAVVSIGNSREAHGPALAPDIDDRVAQAISTRLCDQLGARYLGHAPGCTDGVGEVSRRWSPDYQHPKAFVRSLAKFTHTLIEAHGRRALRLLVLISGHGGNGALGDHLADLALEIGVERCLYLPALRVIDDQGRARAPQHAGEDEHAVALALGPGCIDSEALHRANAAMAEPGPRYRLLRRHPAFAGMAGFYCFGGDVFDVIRGRYEGVKAAVRDVLERRRVQADPVRGREVIRASVTLAVDDVEQAARALGITVS